MWLKQPKKKKKIYYFILTYDLTPNHITSYNWTKMASQEKTGIETRKLQNKQITPQQFLNPVVLVKNLVIKVAQEWLAKLNTQHAILPV